MLREILEQPATQSATVARYVQGDQLCSEKCAPILAWLKHVHSKIVIAASGSSRHAGLLAELIIEDLSGIPVDVEYASEYSYRPEKALTNTAVMVISQSGETADTLAALRKANGLGNETLAITNVDDSTMEREATASFPTVAGRERAIPATKSFTAQLLNLYLLALMSAVSRDLMDAAELKQRLAEVAALPGQIEAQLRGWEEAMHSVAYQYREAKNFLFLGRGIHYPIAREGALKLKESAYLHAEGYPSGELKQRLAEVAALPEQIEAQLRGWEEAMHRVAYQYREAKNFLFLGRGIHYPIAREGALKLKESAYLHAEGYPSGELKHGPNALVAEGTPLVMIATVDHSDPDSVQRYEKVVQLMRDMREQHASILAIANTDDATVAELADHTIYVAEMREPLLAICETIPLQLLSYWMAINNGIDVDHPRNLTKAVLAE
jgi:glucosamine 6-phosphate synthetase-like amidotransferase/phosphosugar isomerase protein